MDSLSISQRTNLIKAHLKIVNNKEFAHILNTKEARIKALSSTKQNIKKFHLEEINILVEKYNFSRDWLRDGIGYMIFNNQENNKLTIPNKIDFNLAQKEIEILKAYRDLKEDNQIKFYGQIISVAADERLKAQEQNETLEKDAKSAV